MSPMEATVARARTSERHAAGSGASKASLPFTLFTYRRSPWFRCSNHKDMPEAS